MNEGSGDSLAPVCHEDQNREKESKREKKIKIIKNYLKGSSSKVFPHFFFSALSVFL